MAIYTNYMLKPKPPPRPQKEKKNLYTKNML
jgi:hypothetical protein